MCISLSSNDPCLRTKSGSIMYIGHSKKGNEDCNQTDTGTTESEGFIPDEDYNFSNIPFMNKLWNVEPPSEIVIKCALLVPVVLWGIIGNFLLLTVILRNRHLRSPATILIGNLALVDLTALLIHPWVFLIYDIFQNYELGKFGCKVEGATECTLLIASVICICGISYDRLTVIVLPEETRFTRRGAKIMGVVAWSIGFLVSLPLFFYRTYKERIWKDFIEKYCVEKTVIINIYWHIIITMMVWLPLTIMLICYISIFVKLIKYEKNIRKKKKAVQVRYKKRVVKIMFLIIITFMVCRLPFTGLIFYRNQMLKDRELGEQSSIINQASGTTYQLIWFFSKYLIIVNSSINPMIYGLMNEKFRKVLKTMTVTKWLFSWEIKEEQPVVEKKKKTTKETVVGSKTKSKIFIIFKGGKFNFRPTEGSKDI